MAKIYVYRIICKESGKFYIGSTINYASRKDRHLRSLRNGEHHNSLLQKLYDRRKGKTLHWQVKSVASESAARKLEQDLILKYKDSSKCLNIGLGAIGGDNLTNNPNRASIVRRISKSIQRRMDGMTKEEKVEAFGLKGEKNGMYGRTHTEETKQRLSAQAKARGGEHLRGIKKTEEARRRISESARARAKEPEYVNPFKGKQHSEETKKRISAKKKGQKPPNMKRVEIAGDVFESLSEAGRHYGVRASVILYRVRSKNFQDYKYAT